MSVKKKVVWLPYDMDTAIGINNDGQLVFDYRLEDIDHQQGGAPIFNGQDSVIWKNIRAAFPDELATMYRNLRSSGALSYEAIENAFEEHQGKWTEAIFNEDAQFKYINPFIENNANYLYMLLGSKEEQRKWWLYNRFRYIDSKYVAGDARNDSIFLRPYAAANITVRPYADIYATVAWDATITQERAARNTTVTLICPYQQMNGNIVNIYSASQLADVGDLSPLKVGQIDISSATRLQALKVGDASSSYDNFNLYSMSFGNNVLLKTVDVRNCSGFGDTTMQGHTQTTVDLSGCSIIENVYFEGTKIAGVSLPNGGVLKVLHLPKTITNLTVLNQRALTSFEIEDDDYSSITTLRVENSSSLIPVDDILAEMPANSRVRLIGFSMAVSTTDEVEDFYDYLDTMRGLDEAGNNLDTAVVSGTITGLNTITGAWYSAMKARYPYIQIEYQHISSNVYFYNGDTLLTTVTVNDGGNATYSGSTPTKAQDVQYTYSFAGWSRANDNIVDSDALTAVVADRNVYACFTGTLRKYTVTFVKASADGGGTLQTINNVNYGTTITAASSYTGATPTTTKGSATDYPFEGWEPASATVQGNTTFTAKFGAPFEAAEITDSWDIILANIANGVDAYNVGDYKPLDLGTEGVVNMQIVGKNTSPLASGSGTATYDWLSMELLATNHRMNRSRSGSSGNYTEGTGTIGGWEKCEMRSYLKETIKPLIPATVRNAIKEVTKYSKIFDTTGTAVNDVSSTEDVWIPSMREIFGGTSYETQGPVYDGVFTDAASRIKSKVGASSASFWWCRSASASINFIGVGSSGDSNSFGAHNSYPLALGFSI